MCLCGFIQGKTNHLRVYFLILLSLLLILPSKCQQSIKIAHDSNELITFSFKSVIKLFQYLSVH